MELLGSAQGADGLGGVLLALPQVGDRLGERGMSDGMVSGWRVASYTGGQGNCVEVGRSAAKVAVRDTKDEKGPVLHFELSVWNAFTEHLKG